MLCRLLLYMYLLTLSLWSLFTPTTCFQSSTNVWQRHVPTVHHLSQDFPRLSSRHRVCQGKPYISRPLLTLTSTSSYEAQTDNEGSDERVQQELSFAKIISVALLITGTTIGGGFMALPTVVTPTGFFPAALTLLCVWAFLGAQAWTVIEVLCAVNEKGNSSNRALAPLGLAAAARATFGVTGERIVTFLLVLVVEATLVGEISRAGMMLNDSLYRVGCSLAALSVGAVVFGPRTESRREKVATSLNSVLMVIFSTMAIALFTFGVPAADWTRLSSVKNYRNVPPMIPTCLQLLVYGEILPTISQYLNFQKGAIRLATGLGSIIPLVFELGWAALGVGLGTGLSGHLQDPVALLLQEGPIRIPLFCFALSAILTTILGSYLALQSTMDDVLKGSKMRGRQLFSASSIVLPALAIASISPSLFLQAIDFAGSYPVVLLWGIGPPLMALQLKKSMGKKYGRYLEAWIPVSLVVSILLFGMSAIPDVGNLVYGTFNIVKNLVGR